MTDKIIHIAQPEMPEWINIQTATDLYLDQNFEALKGFAYALEKARSDSQTWRNCFLFTASILGDNNDYLPNVLDLLQTEARKAPPGSEHQENVLSALMRAASRYVPPPKNDTEKARAPVALSLAASLAPPHGDLEREAAQTWAEKVYDLAEAEAHLAVSCAWNALTKARPGSLLDIMATTVWNDAVRAIGRTNPAYAVSLTKECAHKAPAGRGLRQLALEGMLIHIDPMATLAPKVAMDAARYVLHKAPITSSLSQRAVVVWERQVLSVAENDLGEAIKHVDESLGRAAFGSRFESTAEQMKKTLEKRLTPTSQTRPAAGRKIIPMKDYVIGG